MAQRPGSRSGVRTSLTREDEGVTPPLSRPTGNGSRSWDVEEELTTETRRSPSTSELYVFIITAVVMLFFAYESGRDSFARDEAWRYVTALGVGYLISRGLAKAGSYESYRRRRNGD